MSNWKEWICEKCKQKKDLRKDAMHVIRIKNTKGRDWLNVCNTCYKEVKENE